VRAAIHSPDEKTPKERDTCVNGGGRMGRSFISVRMEAKAITKRWTRAVRTIRADDRGYAVQLADLSKRHASEAFFAFDDPLEAAVFSILIELMKLMENGDVDP
jgi:hypothetical protein